MESLPASFKAMLDSARVKHYPRGQIILYAGDSPPDAYIVKNGVIKIHDIDSQGNEKILHIVKPYGIIPFAFFSGEHGDTQWFYTALIDCDLYVLPRTQLLEKMKQEPGLAIYLMNWFSLEVHELLVRLSSLGKTNAKDKLVAVLKFLAVRHGDKRRTGWCRVAFPVNHQLLADMVGVTRESAATAMKELQDEGVIRNPRLTVLEIDFEKLTSDKYSN